MTIENPQTIADVEALAAKYGITFSPDDYAQAHERAEQRRSQMEHSIATGDSVKTGAAALVEKFNRFYPKFLQALLGIGDVLITATQTVLIAFGVPVVLVMLLIVEQQRVYYGERLFEVHDGLATFGAWVLVVLNLLFELVISWEEHRRGWTEPQKHEFSFRILSSRIAYMFGRSTDWQPRAKSPALRFKVALRIVTVTILALALGGSMQAVIEGVGGANWLDALGQILTRSTLIQMVTWVGGSFFTAAAVFSAQALSQYVARKVIEIVAIMQSNVDDKPRMVADAAGLTAAMFLYGRLKESQRARRLSAAIAQDMPGSPAAVSGTVSVTVSESVSPVKRRCAHCYRVLPRNARPNKKYCSDGCKAKAFQNRSQNRKAN
jgi:hypothetical protein